jgi:long-chain acyl-CoA synthetase
MQAWSAPKLADLPPDERTIICALPLYHIFALTVCAMWGIREGGLNVLIPNPRDIGGFIKELAKYRFNMLPAVNTLYNALLNHPDFTKLDFSGLKVANGGGMAGRRPWPTNGLPPPASPSWKAMACPRPPRWRPPTASTAPNSPA